MINTIQDELLNMLKDEVGWTSHNKLIGGNK